MSFKLYRHAIFSIFFGCTSCVGEGYGNLSGNDGGSAPINDFENRAYKKALLKCYKTGGNRIVKIEGKLRCY